MDWLTTLNVAILTGSALGATLAGFFAYRRGAREKVLEALVGDQDKRIKQLEDERKRHLRRIQALEAEKARPLTDLTELIVTQHAAQMESMKTVTEGLAEVVKTLANGAKS